VAGGEPSVIYGGICSMQAGRLWQRQHSMVYGREPIHGNHSRPRGRPCACLNAWHSIIRANLPMVAAGRPEIWQRVLQAAAPSSIVWQAGSVSSRHMHGRHGYGRQTIPWQGRQVAVVQAVRWHPWQKVQVVVPPSEFRKIQAAGRQSPPHPVEAGAPAGGPQVRQNLPVSRQAGAGERRQAGECSIGPPLPW